MLFDDAPNLSKKVCALARKPNKSGLRYSGFVINGCRFHTISREEGRKTQNSGVVMRSDKGINYYGRLSDIIEISYEDQYKVVLFKCEWYDVHHRAGLQTDVFGFTLVNFSRMMHTGEELEDEPFVFSSQAEQIFYVEDGKTEEWHVVRQFRPRDLFDTGTESSLNNAV